jgi:hypothetical protein
MAGLRAIWPMVLFATKVEPIPAVRKTGMSGFVLELSDDSAILQ